MPSIRKSAMGKRYTLKNYRPDGASPVLYLAILDETTAWLVTSLRESQVNYEMLSRLLEMLNEVEDARQAELYHQRRGYTRQQERVLID